MATPEVLIVDDDLETAESYAALVRAKCHVSANATNNPKAALEAVRTEPIRVVVLDQKMPEMTGTELFAEMRRYNPSLTVLMLSGEASSREVGEALNLGYSEYLHKSKIDELPSAVFRLLAQNAANVAKSYPVNKARLLTRGSLLRSLMGAPRRHYLLASSVIDEDYIDDCGWRTTKNFSLGETYKNEEEVTLQAEVKVEEKVEAQLKHEFSLTQKALSELKSALTTAITASHAVTRTVSAKTVLKKVVEGSLPQNEEVDGHRVVSRSFERADVYRRISCLVMSECGNCGTSKVLPVVVNQPTARIALRICDHLDNGEVKVYTCGIHLVDLT